MFRKLAAFATVASILAACSGGLQSGGNTGIYAGYSESGPISQYSSGDLQTRHVDAVNAVRSENGASPVTLSAPLTASALTHARDMAVQQRAWDYGSDKSSPQTRAEVAGYRGLVTGENTAETFRGEFEVLQVWLSKPISRAIVLDKHATDIGLAWYMEANGKVWWVQVFADRNGNQTRNVYVQEPASVAVEPEPLVEVLE